MAKAQWEADARDRLITYLSETYAHAYVTTGEKQDGGKEKQGEKQDTLRKWH